MRVPFSKQQLIAYFMHVQKTHFINNNIYSIVFKLNIIHLFSKPNHFTIRSNKTLESNKLASMSNFKKKNDYSLMELYYLINEIDITLKFVIIHKYLSISLVRSLFRVKNVNMNDKVLVKLNCTTKFGCIYPYSYVYRQIQLKLSLLLYKSAHTITHTYICTHVCCNIYALIWITWKSKKYSY